MTSAPTWTIAEVAEEFEAVSGRRYAVVEPYELDAARRVIVSLGSTGGTVKDVVDELRDEGDPVGLLKIVSFRPFPAARVGALLRGVSRCRCWSRLPAGIADGGHLGSSRSGSADGSASCLPCRCRPRSWPISPRV